MSSLERVRRATCQVKLAEALAHGGVAKDLPGVTVAATCVPGPFNPVLLTSPDALPVALEEWAALSEHAPGLLVPEEYDDELAPQLAAQGLERLLLQACMDLDLADRLRPPAVAGLVLESADADLDAHVAVQASAFGTAYDALAAYLGPLAHQSGVELLTGWVGDEPVASSMLLRTDDGVAGVYGVGVVPGWRRQGVGAAITIATLDRAAEAGCDLAYLNPSDMARGVYAGLGFAPQPGWAIWVSSRP